MEKGFGFWGKGLLFNLESREIKHIETEPEIYEKFLGGFGTGIYLAKKYIVPKCDPLSPENPIIISAGTFVGTLVPGACRIVGITKQPLTLTIGAAGGSMRFGFMLKLCGYDYVVIVGSSKNPVYIFISDEKAEIKDASELWGKDIFETTSYLQSLYPSSGVIATGPCGENLIRFAITLCDGIATLGRGGLGAVFGAKKLKAILALGKSGIMVKDRDKFLDEIFKLRKRFEDYKRKNEWIKYGFMAGWDELSRVRFPYKSWNKDRADKVYGKEVYVKFLKKRISCPSCLIADKDFISFYDGKNYTYLTSFSSVARIGVRMDLDNTEEAIRVMDVCNRYGICYVTLSSIFEFLKEIFEEGVVSENMFLGFRPDYSFSSAIEFIELIKEGRGIGEIIKKGWREILNYFGKEACEFAAIVKGIDYFYDPRISALGTMEFEQVVNPRGAGMNAGGSPTYIPNFPLDKFPTHIERMGGDKGAIERIMDPSFGVNVGRLTRYSEDWYSALTSLGICNRAQNNRFYSAALCAKLFEIVTGISMDKEKLMKAAERSWNLYKILNVEEGFSAKDDKFPKKWLKPLETTEGPLYTVDYMRKKVLDENDFSKILKEYYDERGWDVDEGIPKAAKIKELSLSDFCNIEDFPK